MSDFDIPIEELRQRMAPHVERMIAELPEEHQAEVNAFLDAGGTVPVAVDVEPDERGMVSVQVDFVLSAGTWSMRMPGSWVCLHWHDGAVRWMPFGPPKTVKERIFARLWPYVAQTLDELAVESPELAASIGEALVTEGRCQLHVIREPETEPAFRVEAHLEAGWRPVVQVGFSLVGVGPDGYMPDPIYDDDLGAA